MGEEVQSAMEEFFASATPEGHTNEVEFAKGVTSGMKRVLGFPLDQIEQCEEILEMYKREAEEGVDLQPEDLYDFDNEERKD